MIHWSGLLALACLVPAAASAQDSAQAPVPARLVSLSLAEALQQARAHSPMYRQALNDAGPAKWGVRNAYGSLLPSVTASSDLGYTGSGQSNFGGGFTRPTSAFLTSGYSLVQLIETSSITAHFSEGKNSVYLNIFSCKSFDPADAAKFCQDYFKARKVVKRFIVRK